MSGAAKALQGAIALLTKFYESPSLAHTDALVLIDAELPVLRAALDDEMWPSEKIVKYLSDAIPKGERNNPSNEFIRVRMDTVQEAIDHIERGNKGLAEWRDQALLKAKHLAAVQATARVAIGHLQTVLNKCRTAAEQQKADTAARDWLTSIGSDPS